MGRSNDGIADDHRAHSRARSLRVRVRKNIDQNSSRKNLFSKVPTSGGHATTDLQLVERLEPANVLKATRRNELL
jgi:hypothetical protein